MASIGRKESACFEKGADQNVKCCQRNGSRNSLSSALERASVSNRDANPDLATQPRECLSVPIARVGSVWARSSEHEPRFLPSLPVSFLPAMILCIVDCPLACTVAPETGFPKNTLLKCRALLLLACGFPVSGKAKRGPLAGSRISVESRGTMVLGVIVPKHCLE
jgi:hypothetical protein